MNDSGRSKPLTLTRKAAVVLELLRGVEETKLSRRNRTNVSSQPSQLGAELRQAVQSEPR